MYSTTISGSYANTWCYHVTSCDTYMCMDHVNYPMITCHLITSNDNNLYINAKMYHLWQDSGVSIMYRQQCLGRCSGYASMLQTREELERKMGLSSTATNLRWRQVMPTYQSLQRVTSLYVLCSRTRRGDVQWVRGRRQEDKLDSKSDYSGVYILQAEYNLLSYHWACK